MCIHHHEFGARLKKAADAAGAEVYFEHLEDLKFTKDNLGTSHIEMAAVGKGAAKKEYKNAMEFILDHVGLDKAAAQKLDTTGDYCGEQIVTWLC